MKEKIGGGQKYEEIAEPFGEKIQKTLDKLDETKVFQLANILWGLPSLLQVLYCCFYSDVIYDEDT